MKNNTLKYIGLRLYYKLCNKVKHDGNDDDDDDVVDDDDDDDDDDDQDGVGGGDHNHKSSFSPPLYREQLEYTQPGEKPAEDQRGLARS